MADFEVSIGAKLGDALNNLTKLREEGKITDKQFATVSKTIEKGFRSAEKEAKRLRDALKKDIGKDGKAAFDAVKNAAEGFGGKIGGSVAMVEKFGKAAAGIAGPLGPVAAVAAAGGLAIGGLGVAAFAAADKMIEAADAAADFARANQDLIPPATLQGLLAFDDALDASKTTAKATAAIFVGELAPGLEGVARLAIKAGLIIQDHMGLATAAVRGLADGVLGSLVPGLGLLTQVLGTTPTEALAKSVEALDTATSTYDERVDALIKREGERRMKVVATTEATKAQTVATDDQARADQEAAEAWLRQQAERAKFSADIIRMVEEERAASIAAAQAQMEASRQVAAAHMESARLARQAWGEFASSSFQAVQNFGDLAIQNAQENDKISQTQAQRRIAVAFALQKTAAISQAAITGADAYLKMVAFFAPFMGPAALGAAAAVTVPLVASQVAVIAAQKPPTFATGGMVGDKVDGDHVTIAASRDEAVLTGRGVAAVGGPAGVAAANAGRGSPTTIVVQLDRDVIARVVLDPANAKQIARAVAPHLRSRGM